MTSRDPRAWMWAEALELLDRADRLHRQFFQLGRSSAKRPTWEPPIDVFESERELAILVALPGVAPDQVEVVIDGTSLIIVGMRPIPVDSRSTLIHRLEIPYGRFERQIDLPPARFELTRRDLIHGCLLLTLSKLD